MRNLNLFLTHALCLAIGICGTMALQVVKPGPGSGDWLTFVGALVGVGLTVMATLWIENYRSSVEARKDRDLMLATLKNIRRYFDEAIQPRGDMDLPEALSARATSETRLLRSLNMFNHARGFFPKRAIEAWYAIEQLSAHIARELPTIEREVGLIGDEDATEPVLAINITKMQQIDERLRNHVFGTLLAVTATRF